MTSYAFVCSRDLTKEMAPQPEPRTTTVLRPVPVVGGTSAASTDVGGSAMAARGAAAARTRRTVPARAEGRGRGEAPPRTERAGSAAAAVDMASISPFAPNGVFARALRSRECEGVPRRRSEIP